LAIEDTYNGATAALTFMNAYKNKYREISYGEAQLEHSNRS
jgi:hypothetical protein